ncbi:hypothetical protein JCM3765_000686 [Sporobolomyces pararoseus]
MSRSPSPWGQKVLSSPSPVSSPVSSSPSAPTQRSLLVEEENDNILIDGSANSSQSSLVHSTVPPCKPQLPPSPRTAQPITPSILLNPLSAAGSSSSSSSSPPSTGSSILKRLPGKRRQSVVVEVHHSPPPAHFYQDPETSEEERVGRTLLPQHQSHDFTNMSPPRPDLSGMRSRSASPSTTTTPRSASPVQTTQPIPTFNFPPNSASSPPRSSTSPPPLPNGVASASSSSAPTPSFVPLSSIISNRSTSSNGSGSSIRFAPLPPGKSMSRAANGRSNSISLGVASRARMINAQGGTPNVQQARYAGPLQWYEGGEMPEDVYTWRDAQRGISKIWKKVNGNKGKEKEKEKDKEANKERSNSLSSTTSGGSLEEARRMEREAKSGGNKGEVEHVEEAIVEEPEDEEDEGEEDTESEVTAPRTPPEGTALGLTNVGVDDVELEKERRRREKGKGKLVESAVVSPSPGQPTLA